MATLGSRAVEKRAVLRNEVVSATETNSKHTSNAVYGTDSLRSTFEAKKATYTVRPYGQIKSNVGGTVGGGILCKGSRP